jgi:hypothetical protein
MSLKSIQLYNIAVWHLEQVNKSTNDRDRNRHAEIADRLFILSHWTR